MDVDQVVLEADFVFKHELIDIIMSCSRLGPVVMTICFFISLANQFEVVISLSILVSMTHSL